MDSEEELSDSFDEGLIEEEWEVSNERVSGKSFKQGFGFFLGVATALSIVLILSYLILLGLISADYITWDEILLYF